MKARRIMCILCVLSTGFLAGCSIGLRQKHVELDDKVISNLPIIDPNDPDNPIAMDSVETSHGKGFEIKFSDTKLVIDTGGKPCRIEYYKRNRFSKDIGLEGAIKGSPKKYRIVFDTGNPAPAFVNDIHILDNNLAVHSFPGQEGMQSGFCIIPGLRIGELSLSQFIAPYRLQHSQLQFMGIPLSNDETLNVGLGLMQKFKYILFDNIKREMEFSSTQSFAGGDPNSWLCCPFSVKPGARGSLRLFVEMQAGGQTGTWFFDSGCQAAMVTTEEVWKQTATAETNTRKSFQKVYMPYHEGKVRSRLIVAKKLAIKDRVVQNAKVVILPDDNPIFESNATQNGILGMQCFDDTILVLDFEQSVMWVKKGVTDQAAIEEGPGRSIKQVDLQR